MARLFLNTGFTGMENELGTKYVPLENKIIYILMMTCSWLPSAAKCGENISFLQQQFHVK